MLLSALSLLLAASSTALVQAQQVCNGNAALCTRQYSQISQIGAHDSAAIGSTLADNQVLSVTDQLNSGIRFLQGQTHLDLFKVLSFCHTSCYLEYGGPVKNYLASVKSWLDANPDDVVTLLLTNGDRLDPSKFDDAFKAAELDTYAFVPSTNPNPLPIDQWPTLQDMISAGTRLVVFLGMSIALPLSLFLLVKV
jgi:hypothetical protein